MKKIAFEGKELLPPKADTVFKRLFTKKNNYDLLASLVGSILGMDIKPEEIGAVNSEIPPVYEAGKLSRLDVVVNIPGKTQVDIEIQLHNHKSFVERSIYYLSKLYSEQLSETEPYQQLIRTVAINILDYKMFPFEKYYSCFRLIEQEAGLELTDKFEVNFLELPKVPKDDFTDLKALWAQYLSTNDKDVLQKLAAKNPILGKAVDELAIISADEAARYEHYLREKARRDYISFLADSRDEGKQEGIQEGLEKGIKKGLEKGRQEREIEIAAKLLQMGITQEEVSKGTGLSLEEVRKLI